jgi:hypothetical protein
MHQLHPLPPFKQCNATDLAPVTITFSPPSGQTVGSGSFVAGGAPTTVGGFELGCFGVPLVCLRVGQDMQTNHG